jgi:CO/xanthine dehydrogenase FAD-binding subunit
MDLNSVEEVVVVRDRNDLPHWRIGDAVIAGGSWLLSEAQDDLRRLVDITALGWEPATVGTDGLELAATCTVEQLCEVARQLPADWTAAPLLEQCAGAFLASFKIWKTATVGGNICLSFPAGPMISLAAALDATLVIWRPDGSDYSVGVADFVTGAATNVLAPGEILRSVWVPATAMRARVAYRRIALAPLGRTGALLIGRLDRPDDGGVFTLTVTGATARPHVVRFPGLPGPAELADALAAIPDQDWHTDAHGAADWRAAVSAVLAYEICEELQ